MFKKAMALLLALIIACGAVSTEPAQAATKVKKLKLLAEGDGGFYTPSQNTIEYISFAKGEKGYIITNVRASSVKAKPVIKVKSNKPKLVKVKAVVRNGGATAWSYPRNVLEYTAKKNLKNITITFTVSVKGSSGKTLKKKMKVNFNDY